MSGKDFITETDHGFRLCCPVCGVTQTFVNPCGCTAKAEVHATCKRCRTPVACRTDIEAEIKRLCDGNPQKAHQIREDVLHSIERLD